MRPYSRYKFVWADVQRLQAPLFDVPVLWLSLAVQAGLVNSLCPIHPHHPPDPHPTGPCQRRGRAARRRGCSLGRCGGSSWHSERTAFQKASVAVRSQTSQGQVSGPALIYSATTPKSVKIRPQQRSGAERGHTEPYAKPSCPSPSTHICTARDAHDIKQLATEGKTISGDTRHRFFSAREPRSCEVLLLSYHIGGYIHKHPTSR